MDKYVGKVKINYDCYCGRDLYSDGAVEDMLLEIAENNNEESLNSVIAKTKDWAVLYHFSHIRQNILGPIDITKDMNVLEIGSGCGAITGALADRAKSVTCIELSEKRSLINANRNREHDNIEIRLGNFQDVEKGLTDKYDIITLIGVFEYGENYIDSDRPYEEFLSIISSHLSENGQIVIAIENKYGLKYWAGCQEDHFGGFFEGIEGYPRTKGVRTFALSELKDFIMSAGCEIRDVFFPYPDYKLPRVIFSRDYLPKPGELKLNIENYDRDRLVLFDENKVYSEIIKDGMFEHYSNSYLITVSKCNEVK